MERAFACQSPFSLTGSTKIMAKYGLSDWKNWRPEYGDPFNSNYVQRLEKITAGTI